MLLFSFIEMCNMFYDIAHDCYTTIINPLHRIIFMYMYKVIFKHVHCIFNSVYYTILKFDFIKFKALIDNMSMRQICLLFFICVFL